MTNLQRMQCSIQGQKRARLLAYLRAATSCPLSASIRERLEAASAFHDKNQNYSINLIADAVRVSRSRLREFLKPRSRARGVFFDHRVSLCNAIEKLAEDDWQFRPRRPGIKFTVQQLRKHGYKCSVRIVTELLRDMGYTRELDKLT